jgi:plasmid stabilization system protein ParE
MWRTLTISAAAARDLKAARKWLRQPGAGETAVKRLSSIRSAIKELRQYPCRWPEGEHQGVRERPVEGYMIMYEIHLDTGDNRTAGDVQILRVFGPHQLRERL